MESRKIAVLCNYELLPERVGGMDCFFWQFDEKCKEKIIQEIENESKNANRTIGMAYRYLDPKKFNPFDFNSLCS